jgi:hypothetical protein
MDEKGTFDTQSFAPSVKRLFTEKEAAEHLGCSIDTIRRMRTKGILPWVPMGPTGRMIRYVKGDLYSGNFEEER